MVVDVSGYFYLGAQVLVSLGSIELELEGSEHLCMLGDVGENIQPWTGFSCLISPRLKPGALRQVW